MIIDRRYRPRRRRSPWGVLVVLGLLAAIVYVGVVRTQDMRNPFTPPTATPIPTRSAASYLVDADDAYKAGRLAEARTIYAQAATLEPTNDAALSRVAFLWIVSGHPERGVEVGRRAVEVNPSAMNLGILAMAYDWNGDFEEAMKAALKAVDKDPASAEAHAFLAEVYADRNNATRALEEAQTANKLNPSSGIVQRNLGYVLERLGRYKEARAAYDRAVQIEPKWGYIHIGAGQAYLAQADYANAVASFQLAVQANPDLPTGYDALGHASSLSGDADRAIIMLRRAIEIDPEYGPALAHLGRVYFIQLNWEAAVEYFSRGFELGVRNEEYFYELGLAYAYLKDCKNSIYWMEKTLTLNPDSQPAREGMKLCTKG